MIKIFNFFFKLKYLFFKLKYLPELLNCDGFILITTKNTDVHYTWVHTDRVSKEQVAVYLEVAKYLYIDSNDVVDEANDILGNLE